MKVERIEVLRVRETWIGRVLTLGAGKREDREDMDGMGG